MAGEALMNRHTFQGEIGCAEISMFTICHISEFEAFIRELVDEKGFQLASYAFSLDYKIKEGGIMHPLL